MLHCQILKYINGFHNIGSLLGFNIISKLILQWGKISTTGNTTSGNILNLPTSYTSNDYCVAVCPHLSNPNESNTSYTPVITNKALQKLTFYWVNAYANRCFYIITIGY